MKKIILLLFAMIVISVGFLSGCDESTSNGDTTGDSDGIELVNYKIETFGSEMGEKPEKIGDGFIHNETAKNGYYKITGTIKNIAGRMLNNITIIVNFYDINHTYLESESENIINLLDTETADFNIIYLGSKSYFEDVDQIEFDILIGLNETTSNGDTNGNSDGIELVNYKIETFGAELGLKPEKIGDGFIHNETAKNGYYKITGTIKNIAGRMLKKITVKVDFYDLNQTYLGSESQNISNLPDTETADFKIICLCFESFFEDVDQIEFDISAV